MGETHRATKPDDVAVEEGWFGGEEGEIATDRAGLVADQAWFVVAQAWFVADEDWFLEKLNSFSKKETSPAEIRNTMTRRGLRSFGIEDLVAALMSQ